MSVPHLDSRLIVITSYSIHYTKLYEEYSDDPAKLMEWIPLMMKDRTVRGPIAATRINSGTDVNFGALTRILFDHLKSKGVDLKFNQHVHDVKRTSDGRWELKVRNIENGTVTRHTAKFVFIGGGGGSLHLLQKSGIPEGKGIGGFPISGLFMVCKNVITSYSIHYTKLYDNGKYKIWSYGYYMTKGQPTGETKAFIEYVQSKKFQEGSLKKLKFIPISAMK